MGTDSTFATLTRPLSWSWSNATLLAADLTRQRRGLQNRRTKIDLMTKNFRYQFPRLWYDNSAPSDKYLSLGQT